MLVPGTVPGFVAFFLHTVLCIVWRTGDTAAGRGTSQQDCPRSCFCNKMSKIVYCSRRGLPFIPSGIPADTLQLNLNGNVFKTTSITQSNFSELQDLEHLYMSECGIEVIEVDTFRDLINLKWLDLSNNRIKAIQANTFRGLTLRHLFINGNRHLELGPASFEGLVTTGLYLHDCSLSKLSPDVLAPLNSTLGYLWLNGNALETVDKKFLSIFSTLSHLRLGSNPLHCNCEVVWLKEFYDKNGGVFEGAITPSCLTPQRLRGKFFNELSLFDLRCQPPVFNNIDAIFGSSDGKLRCAASGDPAPTLYWIQPNGRTTKYAAPLDEDARKNVGELNVGGSAGEGVFGMFICVANNEAGNVTLTINVSLPGVSRLAGEGTPVPPGAEGGGYTVYSSPAIAHSSTPADLPADGAGGGAPGTPLILLPSHIASTGPPQPPTSTPRSPRDQRGAQVQPGDTQVSGPGPGTRNHTTLTMFDITRRRGERLFNLTELIGSVIGTHVCTLLLCLIFMPMYYKRKIRHLSSSSLDKKQPPPSETLYLNGIGNHHPMDYMDTPSTSPHKR